jgi:hypothetical protein
MIARRGLKAQNLVDLRRYRADILPARVERPLYDRQSGGENRIDVRYGVANMPLG